MGNTNSLQSINIENVDAYYQSLQPLRQNEAKSNQNHQNTESYILDRSQRGPMGNATHTQIPVLSPQCKVLPKLTGNRYLRTTTNGQILHAGGTISGRLVKNHNDKTQTPPRIASQMQRSRTFIDDNTSNGIQTSNKAQSPLLRRAKTALDIQLPKKEENINAFYLSNIKTTPVSNAVTAAATKIKKSTHLKYGKKRKAPSVPVEGHLTHQLQNKTLDTQSVVPKLESKPSQSPTKTFIKRDSIDNNKHSSNMTKSKIPQLKRTFYFGMRTEEENVKEDHMGSAGQTSLKTETIEKPNPVSCSREELQRIEKFDADELICVDGAFNKIDECGFMVNVRPTLPRRRLEMPKFSPTAAWHALVEEKRSNIKYQLARNYTSNENGSSTLPLPQLMCKEFPIQIKESLTSTHNKPIFGKDSNRDTLNHIAWTPQQDLDEDEDEEETRFVLDSSSDDCVEKDEEDGLLLFGAMKNSNGKQDLQESTLMHMFSLSLPRDAITREQIATSSSYNQDIRFRSLQKIKNTSSLDRNVQLSHLKNDHINCSDAAKKSVNETEKTFLSDNWVLHKTSRNQRLHQSSMTPISLTYLIGGKHLMYLPMGGNYQQKFQNDHTPIERENKTQGEIIQCKRSDQTALGNTSPSAQIQTNAGPCEDMMTKLTLDNLKKTQRFSFKSPVRVLENKKLAAKLSKDAELREYQRKRELEAMQRVEENFQRKRAAEKINMRYQLNLMLNNSRRQTDNANLINNYDDS